MAAVKELGCIVCRKLGYGYRPCEVHHMLSGSRRISHLHTLGLCLPGHHRYGDMNGNPPMIPRHPWKTRFEEAYGDEAELLTYQREELLRLGHNFLI